jgi:hypothetical protein
MRVELADPKCISSVSVLNHEPHHVCSLNGKSKSREQPCQNFGGGAVTPWPRQNPMSVTGTTQDQHNDTDHIDTVECFTTSAQLV